MATISEQVRRAIEECGMTRYRLSQVSGVSEGMLSRYMTGEREMTLRTLDRLAPFIGVQIAVKRPRQPKQKKGR